MAQLGKPVKARGRLSNNGPPQARREPRSESAPPVASPVPVAAPTEVSAPNHSNAVDEPVVVYAKEEGEVENVENMGEGCGICLDSDVKICTGLCGKECGGNFCSTCLKTYFEGKIGEGYQGSCPPLKCPCPERLNVPYDTWQEFVSEACKEQFKNRASSTLTFQCSSCHVRRSLLNTEPRKDPTYPAEVQEMKREYECGRLHQNQFLDALKQVKCTEYSTLKELLTDVILSMSDMERRASLYNRYLSKHPKFRTNCCNATHCYRCRTAGYHKGRSCEAMQRVKTGEAVVQCPTCSICLVKGDGCASISCVCGTSFNWTSAVAAREQNMAEAFARRYNDGAADVRLDAAALAVLMNRKLLTLNDEERSEASAYYTRHSHNLIKKVLVKQFEADYPVGTAMAALHYMHLKPSPLPGKERGEDVRNAVISAREWTKYDSNPASVTKAKLYKRVIRRAALLSFLHTCVSVPTPDGSVMGVMGVVGQPVTGSDLDRPVKAGSTSGCDGDGGGCGGDEQEVITSIASAVAASALSAAVSSFSAAVSSVAVTSQQLHVVSTTAALRGRRVRLPFETMARLIEGVLLMEGMFHAHSSEQQVRQQMKLQSQQQQPQQRQQPPPKSISKQRGHKPPPQYQSLVRRKYASAAAAAAEEEEEEKEERIGSLQEEKGDAMQDFEDDEDEEKAPAVAVVDSTAAVVAGGGAAGGGVRPTSGTRFGTPSPQLLPHQHQQPIPDTKVRVAEAEAGCVTAVTVPSPPPLPSAYWYLNSGAITTPAAAAAFECVATQLQRGEGICGAVVVDGGLRVGAEEWVEDNRNALKLRELRLGAPFRFRRTAATTTTTTSTTASSFTAELVSTALKRLPHTVPEFCGVGVVGSAVGVGVRVAEGTGRLQVGSGCGSGSGGNRAVVEKGKRAPRTPMERVWLQQHRNRSVAAVAAVLQHATIPMAQKFLDHQLNRSAVIVARNYLAARRCHRLRIPGCRCRPGHYLHCPIVASATGVVLTCAKLPAKVVVGGGSGSTSRGGGGVGGKLNSSHAKATTTTTTIATRTTTTAATAAAATARVRRTSTPAEVPTSTPAAASATARRQSSAAAGTVGGVNRRTGGTSSTASPSPSVSASAAPTVFGRLLERRQPVAVTAVTAVTPLRRSSATSSATRRATSSPSAAASATAGVSPTTSSPVVVAHAGGTTTGGGRTRGTAAASASSSRAPFCVRNERRGNGVTTAVLTVTQSPSRVVTSRAVTGAVTRSSAPSVVRRSVPTVPSRRAPAPRRTGGGGGASIHTNPATRHSGVATRPATAPDLASNRERDARGGLVGFRAARPTTASVRRAAEGASLRAEIEKRRQERAAAAAAASAGRRGGRGGWL